MADIASSDVTYSLVEQNIDEGSGYDQVVSDITFGDGALTYPSGGVPLLKGKLGMNELLRSIMMIDPDASNGFIYKYDATNEKLRIYQGDNDNVADAPLIELVGGVATPAEATLRVEARGY